MSRPARARGLAVLALIFMAASAPHTGAGAQVATARPDTGALSLRLADGSLIRVPCDGGVAEGLRCRPSSARASASPSDAPRVLPLTRRAQLFDANRPGVVASVRG